MKRNLLVFAAAALLVAAAGCGGKDDDGGSGGGATYCYTCTQTSTITSSGVQQAPSTHTTTACGITDQGARSLEQNGTSTTTAGNTTMNVVTRCTRQ